MPYHCITMCSRREFPFANTMNMTKLIYFRLLDDFSRTHNSKCGVASKSLASSHDSWVSFLDCGVIGGWTIASAGRCTQLTVSSGHGLLICGDRIQSISDGKTSKKVSASLIEPGDMM